jgi:membrane-associated phospholipid phosphatase
VLWLCLLVSLSAASAYAEDAKAESRWVEAARADLKTFPDRLLDDAKFTFFDEANIAALLGATAGSIAIHNADLDEKANDWFAKHDTFGGFDSEALNILGSPATHLSAAAIWYVIGAENQDDLGRQRALTMLAALSINDAVTYGLKGIAHRDRPRGGNGWAWPSGHTSSSFTVASVLHEFYGLKVGVPAYLTAGLVAYRMMDVRDHWASDVLFGATLGWVVGHSVARNQRLPEVAGFEIAPYFGDGRTAAVGITLSKQF